MNSGDPLAQLRDIHLPEPISWWPPAPGWWIIALFLLAAICLGTIFIRNRWQQNLYRRTALHELNDLSMKPQTNHQILLEDLSILLRRVALQAYGRTKVAPLSGERWLAFLDRTGRTDQFSRGDAKVLGYGLYRSSFEGDMEQVKLIIQKWIKEHRR